LSSYNDLTLGEVFISLRTQFYLLVAFLLAVLFGVLVFQFIIQQHDSHPQV